MLGYCRRCLHPATEMRLKDAVRGLQAWLRGSSALLVGPPFAAAAAATALSAKPKPNGLHLEGTGASYVSYATYQANDPIEDRFALRAVNGRLLATVFDGHGGWQASEYAHREVPSVFEDELSSAADASDPAAMEAALVRTFTRVDRAFCDAIRGAFTLGFGDVAKVGCCALAAVITPSHLVVANAGDCRAVYGQIVPADRAAGLGPLPARDRAGSAASSARIGSPFATGSSITGSAASAGVGDSDSGSSSGSDSGSDSGDEYEYVPGALVQLRGVDFRMWAVPLSDDHNAREPREVAKLRAAHPWERDIVTCSSPSACYVKGRLQPTRAIGDAYLKHSEFNGPAPSKFLHEQPGEGYAPGTVGSANVLHDQMIASGHAADMAAATARRWGRHIPPPYTPPYITSLPETRVLPLGPVGFGSASSSAGASSTALVRKPDSNGSTTSSASSSAATASAADAALASLPRLSAEQIGDPRTLRFVILGCDGVWDVLSNDEAVHFVANDKGERRSVAQRLVMVRLHVRLRVLLPPKCRFACPAATQVPCVSCCQPSAPCKTPHASLATLPCLIPRFSRAFVLQHVLEREAENEGIALKTMMQLPPGRKRRNVHDDITAVVIYLGESQPTMAAADGAGDKKWWQLW